MDYQQKYYKYKLKYLTHIKNRNNNTAPNYDNLLETNTNKFINSLKNSTPIYKLDPIKAREVLEKVQADQSYKSNVDLEDIDINYENHDISMTIFRPKNNNNILNTIMYFHGGGWVLGSKQTHGRFVSEIAIGSNSAVVFVNYSLAPEAKYPTQLNECYLATKYIYLNGINHNLNTNKLILAGDSAGGNLVAAVTLLSKKYNTPKIASQILLYPVADASMSSKSYNTYTGGPWLEKAGMHWFFDAYLSDNDDRLNPLISPINASIDNLKNLPPGLVITDENDVLRDEGESYAHKLMQAGVSITAVRFLGTFHDFLLLDPLKDTPAAVSCRNLIIDHIKRFNQ